jgi:hypothetical protein
VFPYQNPHTITAFSLLSDHVKDRVDKFCSLGVMTLCPIISSTTLTLKSGGKEHIVFD